MSLIFSFDLVINVAAHKYDHMIKSFYYFFRPEKNCKIF
jgi:hypothetical protein